MDTRWSKILALRDAGREASWESAWNYLHTTYRPAMIDQVRWILFRAGGGACSVDEAEDIVQAFLTACVEKDWFTRATPGGGRFRTFVRVLLKRFTRDYLRVRRAQKRMPKGTPPVPLHLVGEGLRDASAEAPDARLREVWATCLARAALERLRRRRERDALALEHLFEPAEFDPRLLAAKLGVREQQIPVIQHRARRRLAEEIWSELKETVTDAGERDEERRALLPYLSRFLDSSDAPSFYRPRGEPEV